MCGIVGAISERKISRILLEGLKRLEYRGYDSAGIALLSERSDKLQQLRSVGKVRKLSDTITKESCRALLVLHTHAGRLMGSLLLKMLILIRPKMKSR